jgi:hypothetical protein
MHQMAAPVCACHECCAAPCAYAHRGMLPAADTLCLVPAAVVPASILLAAALAAATWSPAGWHAAGWVAAAHARRCLSLTCDAQPPIQADSGHNHGTICGFVGRTVDRPLPAGSFRTVRPFGATAATVVAAGGSVAVTSAPSSPASQVSRYVSSSTSAGHSPAMSLPVLQCDLSFCVYRAGALLQVPDARFQVAPTKVHAAGRQAPPPPTPHRHLTSLRRRFFLGRACRLRHVRAQLPTSCPCLSGCSGGLLHLGWRCLLDLSGGCLLDSQRQPLQVRQSQGVRTS